MLGNFATYVYCRIGHPWLNRIVLPLRRSLQGSAAVDGRPVVPHQVVGLTNDASRSLRRHLNITEGLGEISAEFG